MVFMSWLNVAGSSIRAGKTNTGIYRDFTVLTLCERKGQRKEINKWIFNFFVELISLCKQRQYNPWMLSNCFLFIHFFKTQSLWDSLTPCLSITFCCFLRSLFGWQTARGNKWKTWHWWVSKNVRAKMWLNPLNLIQFFVKFATLLMVFFCIMFTRAEPGKTNNAVWMHWYFIYKKESWPLSLLLELLYILCFCN